MNVKLIAHSTLSDDFSDEIFAQTGINYEGDDRAAIALTAIRTCYSPLKPTEIVAKEGAKYFGNAASDGEGGTDADRLFRHITRSGHTSTLEHITYTFAVEGVSRSLLAQLTRHRHLSFSVQSQRYVRMGSADKSGGFEYVTPPSVGRHDGSIVNEDWGAFSNAFSLYESVMEYLQSAYDALRAAGVPPEDARMVLPNAATCNLVMTGNLRTFLDFYAKRRPGNGAQHEIAKLAVSVRDEIVKVDPWLAAYFDAKEDE
ncbi:FAD-dependent thymidylate synthase [Paenibacillus sp. VCA1]|uniref:FAD-dependent thymidylate synthase n=1 Tax=Paenibacillus sp. VCA1 TaxID=3039148 RepID=UPI002871E790|nr:FAD-dependent thymidylate synthase [Paenibacillus sp. VCA1]MDR9852925.1 FAD-dependent thymidylate synthase [Paenibacillus sp. VCA1]